MTQDRFRTPREHRRDPAAVRGHGWMTHRENTSMHDVQAALLEPAVDCLPTHSTLQELLTCHNPVLTFRQPPDHEI